MILRLYSIKKNFPIYLDYLIFYNCSGTNFMIHTENDYETIEEFNRDPNYNVSYSPLAQKRVVTNFSTSVINDILFQSVLSLKFYGSLFFTHNELDWSKLRFSNNPVHIVTSTPTGEEEFLSNEKIPYEDFIIEMNGTRSYYTHDPFNVNKCLKEEKREGYIKNRIYFYRFNRRMEYFINLRRNNGSIFCLNSFDMMTLFCSLMTLPYFSEQVLDDDKLYRTWLGLWRKEEAHTITKILTSQKKPLLFDDICIILKKFYIRFDTIQYLYNNLV